MASSIGSRFGAAIKTRRLGLKLGQADVAFAAGISRATLINVEKGHLNLHFETALSLAKLLGVDLNTFRDQHPSDQEEMLVAKRIRLQRNIDKIKEAMP
jgi:transcriptional regulator with XRE-family HTH domain